MVAREDAVWNAMPPHAATLEPAGHETVAADPAEHAKT